MPYNDKPDFWSRFEDCADYKSISGSGHKEMDYIFWDGDNKILYLIEESGLKHGNKDLSDACQLEKEIFEVVFKAYSGFLMLYSSLTGQSKAMNSLSSCLPNAFKSGSNDWGTFKINLYFIYTLPPDNSILLAFSGFADKANKKLQTLARCFETIKVCTLMDKASATNALPEGLVPTDS